MVILKDEDAEVEVNRDWSNLPIEIIEKVIRKLFWADRIHFRAVCKAWQLPLGRFSAPEEYPWLLSFVDEKKKHVIKLLNPYRNKNYIVEEFRREEAKKLEGLPSTSRNCERISIQRKKKGSMEGKRFVFGVSVTDLKGEKGHIPCICRLVIEKCFNKCIPKLGASGSESSWVLKCVVDCYIEASGSAS